MTGGRSMDGSVSYELVCAGPVTLDMTLVGLEELPRPGEERFGSELVVAPGAFGTIAVGAARLGLRTAVVAPRPRDFAGTYIASMLAEEGIDWLGPSSERAAVTVVLPLEGERALASYDPGDPVERSLLETVRSGAVVTGIGEVPHAPADARVYVMAGDDRAALERLVGVRAIFANEAEALALTGAAHAEEAARLLGDRGETAVVTRGPRGAIACTGGQLAESRAPGAEAADTTGAGDLFASAYVWADRAGLPLADRLRWSTLYASLSVATLGAVPGAATLVELLAAGRKYGLTPPA
jgi:sugar/nucleoside kinase (ribokinase family)